MPRDDDHGNSLRSDDDHPDDRPPKRAHPLLWLLVLLALLALGWAFYNDRAGKEMPVPSPVTESPQLPPAP
jgi:hypothetical protein